MAWSDLKTSERWSIFVGAVQASATLGMFAVAVYGLTKVGPIITYQTF